MKKFYGVKQDEYENKSAGPVQDIHGAPGVSAEQLDDRFNEEPHPRGPVQRGEPVPGEVQPRAGLLQQLPHCLHLARLHRRVECRLPTLQLTAGKTLTSQASTY